MKLVISLILLILAIGFIFSFFVRDDSFLVDYTSTKTKALCFDRTCRDFLVTCKDKEIVKLVPLSGFVTFSDDWVDLREDKGLC